MVSDIRIENAKFFPNPDTKLWKEVSPSPVFGPEAKNYERLWTYNGLLVICTVGKYDDEKEWVHLSYSRKNRIPDYKDTKLILKHFVGNRKSIMVFPEEKNYVNISENCLHLFICNDKDPLPEFSHGGII